MRTLTNLLLASSLSALAVVGDSPPSSFPNLQVSATQLYRFPNDTYIENLAVQPNNVLILTSTSTNKIFLFDPSTVGSVPSIAIGLPGVTGALGLAEVYPDLYLIAGANVSNGSQLSQSNQTFFLVDFAGCAANCDSDDELDNDQGGEKYREAKKYREGDKNGEVEGDKYDDRYREVEGDKYDGQYHEYHGGDRYREGENHHENYHGAVPGVGVPFAKRAVGCTKAARLLKVLPGRPPASSFLNGVAALGESYPGVALVADSALGVLYRVDAEAGTVDVVFSDPALAPGPGAPGNLTSATLGVNGLKVQGGYVYFTNTYTGVLGRVRVSPDGQLFGTVEVISNFDKGIDDFAILKHTCLVHAAVHPDELVAINPSGPEQAIIVGPGGKTQDVQLEFPTSAAFARKGYGYRYGGSYRKKEKQGTNTLYVVTGGLIGNGPGNATVTGGQIFQVIVSMN